MTAWELQIIVRWVLASWSSGALQLIYWVNLELFVSSKKLKGVRVGKGDCTNEPFHSALTGYRSKLFPVVLHFTGIIMQMNSNEIYILIKSFTFFATNLT